MESDHVRVLFSPSGRRGAVAIGTSLLDASDQLGVEIESLCGGRGACGHCQVEIIEGEFPKERIKSCPSHLKQRDLVEETTLPLKEGRLLACQTTLSGDVVINVPRESQVHPPHVCKPARIHKTTLNSKIKLYYIDSALFDSKSELGEAEHLCQLLKTHWRLESVRFDLDLIQLLPGILESGSLSITLAVYDESEVIAAYSGLQESCYGAAVDIGSTTLAIQLCQLNSGDIVAEAGSINPQVQYGEDVMSRVSYLMMHKQSLHKLTSLVRSEIQSLIDQVCERAGIDPSLLLELTFVGNPIMHHLFLGITPLSLGQAPFRLIASDSMVLKCKDLDLKCHPATRGYLLPCIAGHVGSDAAAMVLAEAPWESEEITLLVDVGTNAEIVLGNQSRLFATSSPTGPAFEGAQIEFGQRAAPGAIERVRIDPKTLEPSVKIIGSQSWTSDAHPQSDLDLPEVTGICGSGIIEVIGELYLADVIGADGRFNEQSRERSSRIILDGKTYRYLLYKNDSITLTISQTDIRAIQLAKAALYAGIRLLMESYGCDRVDRIRLAGAFGGQIDVKYAMILGMIPDCPLDQVSAAGNAAGTGARVALLDSHSRNKIEQVVEQITKIETAIAEGFQELFVDAMAIPHSTDPFVNLDQVVALPDRRDKPVSRRRRRG